jgi:TolB-like protein
LKPFFPLGTLSGDPDQEYFVDGTTDELITDLAQKCILTTRAVLKRAGVAHSDASHFAHSKRVGR